MSREQSPRGAVHRSVAAAICALALVGVVACSPGATGNNNSSGWNLTPTTPVAKGAIDSITWNLGAGEPASLDYSYTWDTASGNIVLANLCDNLMRQNQDGTYAPGIASSVATPDSTTYVYSLRSGVKFTDGSPLTAQDVVFSLNRQMDPAIAGYWSVFFANVSSITATGPSQVTVKLKKPDVVFGEVMSTPAGAIVQKKFTLAKGKNFGTPSGGVMCSGPYSLASWTAGDSITLKANANYWDPNLRPKVGTIRFTFVRNPSTVTNALLAGSIDGAWNPPLSGLTKLKQSPTGTLFANTSALGAVMEMSSFKGALKDVRIRQALQKSIDYTGIVHTIMRDAATPAAALPTSVTWGYAQEVYKAANATLPPAKQDIAGATKLVKAAGTPTAPIVIAYDAADDTSASVVASVQDSAKKVGLTVQLKPLPTQTYLSLYYDTKARAGVDMFMVTSTFEVPDPEELYFQMLSPGPYNYTGYQNPAFNGPVTQAVGVSDPQERARLVTQAQASATEQVQLWLSIYNPYQLLYMRKGLSGPAVWTFGSLYYPWAATLGAP